MSSDRSHERFTPAAAKEMAAVEPGTWSQLRADFESWLLSLLQTGGLEELRQGVSRLNGLGFSFREESVSDAELTFTAPLPGTQSAIRITGYSTPAFASADVRVLMPAPPPTPPDPRHERFYALYEGLWDLATHQVAGLDPLRRAVFLVGRLEAELNNGGIGQYLANKGEGHLTATLGVLRQIAAPQTLRVCEAAVRLMEERAVAADEAWDALTLELAELDEAFFQAGEDLSGAVIDAFGEQTGPARPPDPERQ